MAGYGHPSVGRKILAQDDVYVIRHSAVFERYERLLDVSLTSSYKTPGEPLVSPPSIVSLPKVQ